MESPRLWTAILPCALLSAVAVAQHPSAPSLVVPAAARPAVIERDGALVGSGSNYQATCDRDGLTFAPSFGQRASRVSPLRFELQAVGRGGNMRAVPEVDPRLSADGRTVRYDRGATIERYEFRSDGVEQTFTFATLPPGSGDLVVRGRIDTDLHANVTARWADELSFEATDLGGVHFGAITGIDARGARVPGQMRFDGRELELRLPAKFVEDAALPLVLDPLIGSSVWMSGAGIPFGGPTYESSTDTYLFATEKTEGLFGMRTVIDAQRVSGDGSLVGGPIRIHDGDASRPRVARVDRHGLFVVVFAENSPGGPGTVAAATIDAATGAVLQRRIVIASSSRTVYFPDVSGDASTNTSEVVFAWHDLVSGLQLRKAEVAADGTMSLSSPVTFGGAARLNRMAPTRSAANHYLVLRVSSFVGGNDISALVVDQDLREIGSLPLGFPGRAGLTAGAIHYAGQWTVVLEQFTAPGGGPGPQDVFTQSLSVRGGTLTVSPPRPFRTEPSSEYSPQIATLGESALIGWIGSEGVVPLRHLQMIDPLTGVPYGPTTTLRPFVPPGTLSFGSLAVGGRDDPVGEALVLFGTLEAQLYRAADGIVTPLGGACGASSTVHAPGAVVGNRGFTMHLRDASRSALATLIVSAGRVDAPCGSCILVPEPAAGVMFFGVTDAFGHASLNLPIPNLPSLVGGELFSQWAVLAPGSTCAVGLELSGAQSIVLE